MAAAAAAVAMIAGTSSSARADFIYAPGTGSWFDGGNWTDDKETPETTDDTTSDSETEGPICGDGILDVGEACDDGNDIDDDGCANDCTLPAEASASRVRCTERWLVPSAMASAELDHGSPSARKARPSAPRRSASGSSSLTSCRSPGWATSPSAAWCAAG